MALGQLADSIFTYFPSWNGVLEVVQAGTPKPKAGGDLVALLSIDTNVPFVWHTASWVSDFSQSSSPPSVCFH